MRHGCYVDEQEDGVGPIDHRLDSSLRSETVHTCHTKDQCDILPVPDIWDMLPSMQHFP
jgi:hypothetical protein